MPAGDDSRDPGGPPSTGREPYGGKRSNRSAGNGGNSGDQPGSTTPDPFVEIVYAAQVGNNISFSIRTLSYDQAGNPNTKTLDWVGTPEEFNDIEWGKFADYLGLDAGVFENLIYNKYFWKGSNGDWIRNTKSYYGNQYHGSKKIAMGNARIFKYAGRGLFIWGLYSTAYEVNNPNNTPDDKVHSLITSAMGALATFGGPPGLVVGGYWLILDFFGYFDSPMRKESIFDKMNRLRCHPNW